MKDYLKKIEPFLESEVDPAFARRARIILENLDLTGNEKILEVGCGRGFYLRVLKSVWPVLAITGVDLNPKYLKKAEEFMGELRVDLRVANATKLPFKDKTFDRIIATEILEHIPDDEKAISEMFRVLKTGGTIMVTVPSNNYPFLWDPLNWILERTVGWHLPSNIWWLSGIWADHIRLYDERQLKDKMESNGFKVEKVWYATHYCFPFAHFLFYGIGKNLVEKGIFPDLNRFKQEKKQTKLFLFVTSVLRKIDIKNDSVPIYKNQSSMNLCFLLKK